MTGFKQLLQRPATVLAYRARQKHLCASTSPVQGWIDHRVKATPALRASRPRFKLETP
jgi:hypothetical protein